MVCLSCLPCQCQIRMNVLLAENLGDEEEAESPALLTADAWGDDFNEYLDAKPEVIPPSMTLMQWWRVCAKF